MSAETSSGELLLRRLRRERLVDGRRWCGAPPRFFLIKMWWSSGSSRAALQHKIKHMWRDFEEVSLFLFAKQVSNSTLHLLNRLELHRGSTFTSLVLPLLIVDSHLLSPQSRQVNSLLYFISRHQAAPCSLNYWLSLPSALTDIVLDCSMELNLLPSVTTHPPTHQLPRVIHPSMPWTWNPRFPITHPILASTGATVRLKRKLLVSILGTDQAPSVASELLCHWCECRPGADNHESQWVASLSSFSFFNDPELKD